MISQVVSARRPWRMRGSLGPLRVVKGFTLIELMVVVAIVVLAMGIMTPTLIEFFKNQKLKNVRTHFISAFNLARLHSITEGTPMQVVFFREGVRVYHERNRAFRKDEEFNPEGAPGALNGITFELRFAQSKNDDLVAYRDWEKKQPNLNAPPNTPDAGECSVEGLVAMQFQRDGTITWLKGNNIATSAFNKDPPDDADIIVRQDGNPEALFVDVSQTGKLRVKFAPSPESREGKR
jgi:prepilin-type N-terminal cleavage/methylation domain-containing protein